MEKMQRLLIFLTCCFIGGIHLTSPHLLYGQQTSIIDQIHKLQPAIVSIDVINSDIFKSKPALGRDPKTGRIVVLRSLTSASFNRYGAGVVIHPSGVIVTNSHTVNKGNKITVIFHDQRETPAQVLRVVHNLDIALLKVSLPYPLKFVKLADSDKIKLGDEIITVGNSQYFKQTVTGGKIIGIGQSRQEKRKGRKRTDLIQTTVNLYSGDSGGPLFDRDGRLIGLMTAKETAADHSSFAVPSNKIKTYLLEYLNRGRKP